MTNVIVTNKKAAYDYFILSKYEAGIVLQGSEIKSIRNHAVNLKDSYVVIKNQEVFILNMHIAEYSHGNLFNHDPFRTRKLLLHKKEILKMQLKIKQEGFTLIPTKLYFNEKGKVKVEIALAKGKKLYDKRETIKQREQKRELQKNYKQF
jgi:ssrA-binding protein